MEIEKQYDKFTKAFVEGTRIYNEDSDNAFYSFLDVNLQGKTILDVGCGEGYDLVNYQKRGAIVHGLDASKELLKLAKQNAPTANLMLGVMENLPYKNETFDIVVSKYALQTSTKLERAIDEIGRVLKPNGLFVYLACHPIRQFLEKKKHPKDYFLQEIVHSVIFEEKVTVEEPSHTLQEYLNSRFLSRFRILDYREDPHFPDAERIEGDNYPCFFVLKAQKLN